MSFVEGKISKDGKVVKGNLSRSQVAGLFGVDENTVDGWCDEGLLAYYQTKPRGRKTFAPEDVDKLAERLKVAAE